ncbi:hypothetical protein AVEN_232436-1, partial [Araneus ventricosus]
DSLREISSPKYSTCGLSLRVTTSPQLKASSLSRNICLAVSWVCKRHLSCSCSNVKLCAMLVCVSIDSTSLGIAQLRESSSETPPLMAEASRRIKSKYDDDERRTVNQSTWAEGPPPLMPSFEVRWIPNGCG